MTFLADACALIVFLSSEQPEREMPMSASIMRQGAVSVLSLTLYEISRKVALGKLPAFWNPWPSLSAVLIAQDFRRQDCDWEDAEAANALPRLHKDPVDRLLIAVALRAGKTVITSDRIFNAYNVSTVW